VSLSALGIGDYNLTNGHTVNFYLHPSLRLHFNFQKAFDEGVIKAISCDPNMNEKLRQLNINEALIKKRRQPDEEFGVLVTLDVKVKIYDRR
jgi:hypothetical protein